MEETNQTNKRKKIEASAAGISRDDEYVPTYDELKEELFDTRLKLEQALIEIEELKGKSVDGANIEEEFSDDEDEGKTDAWTMKFKELRQYRMINGDCKVMQKTNQKLWKWLCNQKLCYVNVKQNKNGGKISPCRILKLESLGIHWGKAFPAPPTWEEQYAELSKFKTAMGNCNVFMNDKDPSPLAKWVSFQRSEYKRFRKGQDSLLDLEKIEQLNNVGFNWMGPKLSSA